MEKKIVVTKSQLKRLVAKGLSMEVNLPTYLSIEQEKIVNFANSLGLKTDALVDKHKKKMNSTPPYIAIMVYHECAVFLTNYINKLDKFKK